MDYYLNNICNTKYLYYLYIIRNKQNENDMKTSTETIENTLVAFHTSGGGNRTKKVFIGEDKSIQNFTDHLFMGYENEDIVLSRLNRDNENNESYDKDDVLDCFTDRNIVALKEIYGIEESELGEYGYKDQNGNWMDVLEDAETGTLDEDGYYNTTTVMYLKECSEYELQLILKSDTYVSGGVVEYAKNALEEIN